MGDLTCTTGSKVDHAPHCATLALYGTTARNDALRNATAWKGGPAYLVTAANWTVNLCDYNLADTVATEALPPHRRFGGTGTAKDRVWHSAATGKARCGAVPAAATRPDGGSCEAVT
ncbi:hypothetical protein [Streptomyces sp. NBC_00448]|uniref:hypothetical protein n=1 Tax=Streptomyces sp. NBC_00448 TaxID=2903652 RepID=UPI002E1F466E